MDDDFPEIIDYKDFDGECCPMHGDDKTPLFLFHEDDWGTAYEMKGPLDAKFYHTCSDAHAEELATSKKWVDGKGRLNVILSASAKRSRSMPATTHSNESTEVSDHTAVTVTSNEEKTCASKRNSLTLDTSCGGTALKRYNYGTPKRMLENLYLSARQSPSSSGTSPVRKQDKTSEGSGEDSRSEH